jgi:hypothetical protein
MNTQSKVLGLLFAAVGVEASSAGALSAASQWLEQMSDSEIRESLSQHLSTYLDSSNEKIEFVPTKENLNMLLQLEGHHSKHASRHHHPHAHNLASASSRDIYQDTRMDAAMGLPNPNVRENGQYVSVPIDEVQAIRMHVTPTFERDIVDSVTLKAFRKVIGYDTFASILAKGRDEIKDPDDHYNITVTMMVRRIPAPRADKVLDEWNGGEMITPKLDKGFPYDDGDNTITDAAPRFKKTVTGPVAATTVGKLNGENVTKEALKNLIQDRTSPVAQELVQVEGDGDNVFQLMDSNVTKGQMKNLITDKPAPITVKLAQISGDGDNVFKLMDENVTKGQMKNLITDKPAPITVKL